MSSTSYLTQPQGRGGRGTAAEAGREPGLRPLPQGLGGDVSAAGAARRGCGQPRARRASSTKFRFKGAPYLRSVDLIAEFRKEAKTPEQQQLITDLFERITLYDLKVTEASTRKTGNGWTTTLTVAADKSYASGKGAETKAKLDEPIEVGLFTARPGLGAFSAKDVIVMGRAAAAQRRAADHAQDQGQAGVRRGRSV